MDSSIWILILGILLAITIFVCAGIVIYFKIIQKYKNGFVARIHMADSTIQSYRYDIIPTDNKFVVIEQDKNGNDKVFTYLIKTDCIEKGTWGNYSDYDYQIMTPRPIKGVNNDIKRFMDEIKELYKLIASCLDTDLYVKLLRNQKFEEFMRLMVTIILIVSIVACVFSGVSMIKSLSSIPQSSNDCVLSLDNRTWQTIYIASHTPPQQTKSVIPTK